MLLQSSLKRIRGSFKNDIPVRQQAYLGFKPEVGVLLATKSLTSTETHQGFTLIELLVVIIIIGILSSIALPGFLNQAGRARGSEATSGLGSLHRGLQAFRFQSGAFTDDLSRLDVKLSQKFYAYDITLLDSNNANTQARQTGIGRNDLKNFDGAVLQNTAIDFFGQAICESLQVNSNPGGVTAPTATGDRGSCVNPSTAKLID
jgi:type IV pilus assembly protein PilA